MGIELAFVPQKDSVFIEADKSRISQVISNLLSNAIKFTIQKGKEGEKHGKTILVTIDKDDQHNETIVSIRDSGIGIDSEIFPRLFSKFASKSFEGTGLGLFISKSIIEAHGGKIWAENNATNSYRDVGATFRFSLALSHAKHQDIRATIDS
jgi:signal transduction histidine kinase